MKRLMCFFVIMLLMIPVVGFSDGGVDKSEDQEGSSSICDIKDKKGNSIVNPTVGDMRSNETDPSYQKCLDYYDQGTHASKMEMLECFGSTPGIDGERIKHIEHAACLKGLKRFEVTNHLIGHIDLSGNEHLEIIDLNGNPLQSIILPRFAKNLRVLSLDGTDIQGNMPDYGCFCKINKNFEFWLQDVELDENTILELKHMKRYCRVEMG